MSGTDLRSGKLEQENEAIADGHLALGPFPSEPNASESALMTRAMGMGNESSDPEPVVVSPPPLSAIQHILAEDETANSAKDPGVEPSPPCNDASCMSEAALVEQEILNTDLNSQPIGSIPVMRSVSSSNAAIFGVELPRPWFIACWSAIIALHTGCGLFLLFAGNLNSFLTSTKKVYLAGLATDKLSTYFNSSGIMCRFLGALHLGRVASILLFSLKQREFVFFLKPRPVQRTNSRADSLWKQKTQTAQDSVAKLTRRASHALVRHNLVGENSFAKVFTIQEVVVIISQTYQAYRCCGLVSETWLNGLYIAMVVANCWGIPLLCFLVRNHAPATVQSVLQTADALLNMGSCFIFPFVMFWPYYLEFDMATLTFPVRYRYDSVWTSHAMMKMNMILALSNLDLLSKFVNHLSVFSSLMGVTSLLMQQTRSTSSLVGDSSSKTSVTGKATGAKIKRSQLETVLHAFFVLWAIALLGIYGHAVNRTKTPLLGCQSRTHPWFSSGYPCSVYEFNCYEQNLESPTNAIFRKMNPKTVQYLMITHCPSLHVPTVVQDFSSMMGFTLFNCTIADWPSTSAITAAKHKQLTAVVIARVNMSSFPEGLTQPLPTSIAVVAFSVTNLTTLPSNLYQSWKSVSAFMVLDSELEVLPTDIFQLPAVAFFFSGNRIKALPALDSVQRVIYLIDITSNPIQELPSTINPYAYIGFLDAEYTNISSIRNGFLPTPSKALLRVLRTVLCLMRIKMRAMQFASQSTRQRSES